MIFSDCDIAKATLILTFPVSTLYSQHRTKAEGF